MKTRTGKRSFTYQYRSCSFCCSVDGLVVSDSQQQGDIVSCHVCGGQYLIRSIDPLKLQALPSQSSNMSFG
ncbi:hypothetical protein [Desulfocapsa sulfexigens]|uniref:hypothetical protein n=1 Tax=Desulfocapsa sulfexigens TaxID=65555 RepID=UPI00034510C1|nr:hypothetical protein [Desulfocapsa sulfexigens]